MGTLMSDFQILQKMLFDAAQDGDINLMKECLKVEADPYILDEFGNNAVFYLKRAAPGKGNKLHFWLKLILLHKLINRLLDEKD